jgi:hypothetical protein
LRDAIRNSEAENCPRILVAPAAPGRDAFETLDGGADAGAAARIEAVIDVDYFRGATHILGDSPGQFRRQRKKQFDGLAEADGLLRFEANAAFGQIEGFALVRLDGPAKPDFDSGAA